MCRWIAYTGPELLLEDLLFKPENSLIRQSLSASLSLAPTNGDGSGLGWYGSEDLPGIFRDTLPAWNDANLLSLSQQIRSGMFFAHVRASTGTTTSRENCHPFRMGRTMFMHNGRIGGYAALRRDLERMIPDDLYCGRTGTTDSEAFFLLAVGNGLADDVPQAMAKTISQIENLMRDREIDEPFRMTAAVSDGARIYALRYSSDGQSPSLYYGEGGAIDVVDRRARFRSGKDAVLVLSEPLDENGYDWREVTEAHIVSISRGGVEVQPFEL